MSRRLLFLILLAILLADLVLVISSKAATNHALSVTGTGQLTISTNFRAATVTWTTNVLVFSTNAPPKIGTSTVATVDAIAAGEVTNRQWMADLVPQSPATGNVDGAMFSSTNWTRVNAEAVQLGGLAYAVTGFVVVAGVTGEGATNYNGQYDFATTNFASANGSVINWAEYDNGVNIRTNWFLTWNGSSGFFATNFPTGWETAGEVSEAFGTADYLRTNSAALTLTAASVATAGAWNASVAGASNLALGAYALATNALPMTGGTVTGNLRVTAGVTAATVTATGRLGGNGISLTNTAVVSVTRYAADADGAVVDAWRAGTNFVWFAMQPTNFAGLRIGGPESYTADFTNYTIWIWGTNLQVNGRITGDGSALSGISAGSVTLTSNVVWKVPAMRGFWDISSDVPTNGGASLAFEAPFPTSTVLRASLRTLWTGGAVRVAQGAVMALSSVATNRASVHVDYIAWTNVVTNSVWFTALGSTNALGTTALTTTGVYIVSATNFSGERALIPYFQGTQTGLGATNWGRSFLPNLGEVEQ